MIEIRVGDLELNDAIRIGDLELHEGVTATLPETAAVCSVQISKQRDDEDEGDEAGEAAPEASEES